MLAGAGEADACMLVSPAVHTPCQGAVLQVVRQQVHGRRFIDARASFSSSKLGKKLTAKHGRRVHCIASRIDALSLSMFCKRFEAF